jgi:peptidoglycan/xylan/chitin deacetylase (PgdA/CDA1 family)
MPPRIGTRDPKIESDYDYGARVGVWRLLNMFEKHGLKVTCYAVGQAMEKNPAVAKAFVAGGHEIASHAYRCVRQSTFHLSACADWRWKLARCGLSLRN